MNNYFSLLNITSVYLLNSVFATFLTIIFFVSGLTEIALAISITQSFIASIIYTLSSHSRSLIVSDSNMYKLLSDYFFRIKIASIFLLVTLIFFYFNFYKIENKFTIFVIIAISLLQWIYELNIVKAEIKKDHKFILNINSFLIFIFLIFCAIYLLGQHSYYIFALLILLIFLIIQVIKSSLVAVFIKDKMIFKLKNIFNDKSVISSFFIYFSNFIWKILIVLYTETNFAISVFIIHSLSTFVSSTYTNSFGYTFLKNNKKIILFFFFYFILTAIIIFNTNLILKYLPNNITLIDNPISFFQELIIYSMIGSNLLLFGQFFRSKDLFYYPQYRKQVFLADIYFSILILFYILLIIFFMDIILIKYLFLFSSLTNFFIYYYYYSKKKIKFK